MVRQAAVVSAGLALGVGVIVATDGGGGPTYRPNPPSVAEFAFPTSIPDAPERLAETAPSLAAEPADPEAALTAFLQPLVDGRPEQAYPLLDEGSRRRFPSLASWIRAQPDRPTPLAFELGEARPSAELAGAVEIELSATHVPSLDPIRGLVPGRSSSAWLVRQEGAAWRVASDPVRFRPVLPPQEAAEGSVQRWVSALAACDAPAAAQWQVAANLYGPTGLVGLPCDRRGMWTAGSAVTLDRALDARVFIAAFGPDVGAWARLVPVRGPDSGFLAAVAPLGESWQVIGVAVEGP